MKVIVHYFFIKRNKCIRRLQIFLQNFSEDRILDMKKPLSSGLLFLKVIYGLSSNRPTSIVGLAYLVPTRELRRCQCAHDIHRAT